MLRSRMTRVLDYLCRPWKWRRRIDVDSSSPWELTIRERPRLKVLYTEQSVDDADTTYIFVPSDEEDRYAGFVPIGPDTAIGRAMELLPDMVCQTRFLANFPPAGPIGEELGELARAMIARIESGVDGAGGIGNGSSGSDATPTTSTTPTDAFAPMRWLIHAAMVGLAPSQHDRSRWSPGYTKAYEGLEAAMAFCTPGPPAAESIAGTGGTGTSLLGSDTGEDSLCGHGPKESSFISSCWGGSGPDSELPPFRYETRVCRVCGEIWVMGYLGEYPIDIRFTIRTAEDLEAVGAFRRNAEAAEAVVQKGVLP